MRNPSSFISKVPAFTPEANEPAGEIGSSREERLVPVAGQKPILLCFGAITLQIEKPSHA
jgi:hypothetical protein